MHELRTPLTVLLGKVLRRWRAQGLHTERLDGALDVIEAAVVRLGVAVEEADQRSRTDP